MERLQEKAMTEVGFPGRKVSNPLGSPGDWKLRCMRTLPSSTAPSNYVGIPGSDSPLKLVVLCICVDDGQ